MFSGSYVKMIPERRTKALDRGSRVTKKTQTPNRPKKRAAPKLYAVQKICSCAIDLDGELLFLVKWRDYPPSDNSWEPQSSLLGTDAYERYVRRLGVTWGSSWRRLLERKEETTASEQRDEGPSTE